jgi:NADPH:quinone reductase-like Zn-dependent oxidoreductase
MPAVLGIDVSGEVVEVGDQVKDFAVGEEVWGFLNLRHQGAYAQYVSARPEWLARKPKGLSHEEAAAITGAGETAMQALRDHAKLAQGERVLLVGASGGVGTLALQIAAALGADVTAVCSTRNVDLVRKLGADRVIDYTRENPLSDDARFDVVIDCVGNHSFWDYRKLLNPMGRHVVVPGRPKHMINSVLSHLDPRHASRFFFANPDRDDLNAMNELIEAGRLKPVIARVIPLSEIGEGHRESESGRTVGKIAVRVD